MPPTRNRVAFLLASCLALLAPAAAIAQQGTGTFDFLRLDLGLVANVNRNALHDYWSPEPGVELDIETPFYLGLVELGIQYASFDARQAEQPDFISLFPFLGWGLELPLSEQLKWYNGGRIGSFLMRFDTPGAGGHEQELAMALASRVRFAVGDAWSLHLAAHYQLVFTRERMRLLYITAGFSRSFTTPRWLKEFLD